MVFPPLSMCKSSNLPNAAPVGLWMVQTTVRPSRARSQSNSMTSSAVRLSNPLVGSSRKRTRGLVIMARPILTRLACPPLMPRTRAEPIMVPRQDSRSRRAITSFTRSVRSVDVTDAGSLRAAVYESICSTVSSPTRVSNCSTYPTKRRLSDGLGVLPL
mmetsp:Transcript_26405/g.53637  ORF Transcript_26405/g.53637 Transcript_26405/m.53637 type:complete len:159 (+) Transcript_26405:4641-5117(+)